jgi:hypothetical protein
MVGDATLDESRSRPIGENFCNENNEDPLHRYGVSNPKPASQIFRT